MLSKQFFNRFDGAIPDAQPNEFWWTAVKQTPGLKVGILRHNDKIMGFGMFPNLCVACVPHVNLAHMDAFRPKLAAGAVRDFGQTKASFRQGCQLTLAVSGESKASSNVVSGKVGKLGQHFFLSHSARKIL